jgi:hypothetical protein
VAFGVGIELAQYAGSLIEGFTYRVTDVDDAIMNATGAVVAFFVWRDMERRQILERLVLRWRGLAPADGAARPDVERDADRAEG